MSQLQRRDGTISERLSATQLAPVSGYEVVAYEVGAVCNGANSGTTINVYAGHGFAANDKLISGTTLSTYRTVQSVGATTVEVNSTLSTAEGDVLINLGPDTGALAPAFDGSGVVIYSTPTTATVVTSSRVSANTDGEYGYWHKAAQIWELVLDSNDAPTEYRRDVVPKAATYEGFFGTAPTTQPSAYTQTYATADKTHAALTSSALTDSTTGTSDTTVADVGVAFSQATLNNNFADLTAQVNALRNDLIDVKQLLNSVIDDLQTLGLLQ